MTPVQCIDCELADLKGSREMAENGFARCRKKDKWHYEGLTRSHKCSMFAAAPEDRAAKRREWLSNLRESQLMEAQRA